MGSDEIQNWLSFATKLARNLARRPGIDYEDCAERALTRTLSEMPCGGPKFKLRLGYLVHSLVLNASVSEKRRQARCETVDWEALDELAAPGEGGLESLNGLDPADRELAVDVLVDKITERVAAEARGTSQRQIRKRLRTIRQYLMQHMEATR